MPQLPFGDAYIIQTPALNNAANLLYREQKQREQMGYQDYLSTQQALEKEFQNVRSADIPEIFKAYDTYKFARQQTLFNPKVINDKTAYAQALQKANESKAQLQQLINGSIDLKSQDKNLSEDLPRNRDLYVDDAGTKLANWMQMPMSQRLQLGYIGNTPLLYTGTNTDFGDLEKKAAGDKTTTYQPEALSADKLSYEQKGFTRANNPLQFYNIYSGELAKRKAGQDASVAYKAIPNEDKQYIQDEFNAIPDNQWQMWGIPKPDLNQANGNSDAEKFSILKAQQYAIMNPPQIADTKTRENKGAILNAQLANEKIMEGIRQGNREALAKLRHQYSQADQQSQNNFLDGYIDNLKQDAIKNGGREYTYADGTNKGRTEIQYNIKASPETKKLFEINAQDKDGKAIKIVPDEIRLLKNGDILPIYLGQQGKNNKYEVLSDFSKAITPDEFKLLLAKQFSTSQTTKAMNDGESDDEEDTGGQVAPSKTYNVIDPNTGQIILKGVSKQDADKAATKGYKIK